MRTLLILVDGMRPDALSGQPLVQQIMQKASYTMRAKTVMPSKTLPCIMSLFHSVDPGRHGITTNVHTPQARPIDGLCEVLHKNKKTSAFFYNWEELRDLARPGSLTYSFFCSGNEVGYDKANNTVTDAAIAHLQNNETDFTFLYLGYTDMAGHAYGWMSEGYMKAMDNSWDNIERVLKALPDDYTVIITADHGGHDRMHGLDIPEDMTIPLMFLGKGFAPGNEIGEASIKDIVPTVARLLDIEPDSQWEGKSLI